MAEDLDCLIRSINALGVLDAFLALVKDREYFSRTELMNLALDMRSTLRIPEG